MAPNVRNGSVTAGMGGKPLLALPAQRPSDDKDNAPRCSNGFSFAVGFNVGRVPGGVEPIKEGARRQGYDAH